MKKLLTGWCLFVALIASGTFHPTFVQAQTTATNVVAITGGTLVDGSGSAPLRDAVVVIEGDRIVAAGARRRVKIPAGARMIDARGLIVAPGFVDIHNHSGRGLDTEPLAPTQISQGITTVVLGQDGGSELPVGEYLARRERAATALNVLTFVGHATVRSRVMNGQTNRAATADEVRRMADLVSQAMRDGAFGLSTGLEYETGKPATTGEVVALARVAARAGGIYMSHIRDEAERTMEALREAIRIGEEARLPVQISHIKMGTVSVWGKAPAAVALIEAAQRRGLDVTADCYPYDAWHSTIRVIVPSGRHNDRDDVARGIAELGGAENITIVSCDAHPDYEFKSLDVIAREVGRTPVEVYMQIVKDGGASVVGRSMKEEDIRTFYRRPWVMVSSDGGVGMRHPRGAGTYPRVLGRYVRERRWLTLAEAIRKMTLLPARRLGLTDRGHVRPGAKADLVLFDPGRVIDRSTFREPQLLSEGVARVFVNGVEVWRDGAPTGDKPGRVLRHQKKQSTR